MNKNDRIMRMLGDHHHRFAEVWETSRFAGTVHRKCTFPGCETVTLDGWEEDDE